MDLWHNGTEINGAMEQWSNGTREQWNKRTIKKWKNGKMEHCSDEIL